MTYINFKKEKVLTNNHPKKQRFKLDMNVLKLNAAIYTLENEPPDQDVYELLFPIIELFNKHKKKQMTVS